MIFSIFQDTRPRTLGHRGYITDFSQNSMTWKEIEGIFAVREMAPR